MREADTKMNRAKSTRLLQTYLNKKKPFGTWQNWCFGQFYHSRIDVLQIAQLLVLFIFMSVSSENKSEKIKRKFKT